jgi:hypothetical protein
MKKSLSLLTIGFSLAACGDGQAAERNASVLQTEESVCQLAWEQNEAQLDPTDRMGNPFLMPKSSSHDWRYELDHEGRRIHIMPAQKLSYQVELDASQTTSGLSKIVTCVVPVAWKALDVTLSVAYDPVFQNSRQIMMINGKPFGHESRSGLYLRHQLIPTDLHDINLAWHLQSAALDKHAAIQKIRTQLSIPVEQSVELSQALEHLQGQGPMAIQAIAMTVGTDAIRHWAQLPDQAAALWPKLRFLPIGPVTQESTVENAWKKAGILDLAALKLFDVTQKSLAPCTQRPYLPGCARPWRGSLRASRLEGGNVPSLLCLHLLCGSQWNPAFCRHTAGCHRQPDRSGPGRSGEVMS